MRNRSDLPKGFQNKKKLIINFYLGLIIIIFFSIACGLTQNPFRDYSEKPFDSEEWLEGNAVERGRMFADIYDKQILEGKSKKSVWKMLGKPDLIQVVEDREVWLYYVEQSRQLPHRYFPVSFEDNGETFAGRIKDGTISILVEE